MPKLLTLAIPTYNMAFFGGKMHPILKYDLRHQPVNWYEHLRRTGKVKRYTPIIDSYATREIMRMKFEIMKGWMREMTNKL